MNKLRVSIPSADSHDPAAEIAFEARDMTMALTILDINVGRELAEIWDGEQRLARLSKHSDGRATFWRVC